VENAPLAPKDCSQPSYDESEWPIFIVTLPRTPLSPSAFRAHLDRCGEPYKRGQPFCMLITGDHPPLTALQRKAVADAMKEHDQRHPGVMLGCAIINRSVFARGVITAVTWLAAPAYPFAVFPDAPKAKAWLTQLLGAARAHIGRVWD
jgi:hypothetical protein